jgi:formate dehydrogenase subunit beta
MRTIIPIEAGDVLGSLRSFLKQLFHAGLIEALFVPVEMEGGSVIPALLTDPDQLERANPLAPIMPINAARAVSALTGKGAPARLGAVLRACEIRALIELVKLQQASLESVTLIGIDCPGTFESGAYIASWQAGEFDLPGWLAAASAGQEPAMDGRGLRPACRMCTQPLPEQAAIQLQLFGADLERGIPAVLQPAIAAGLEVKEAVEEPGDRRRAVLEPLLVGRARARDDELSAMRKGLAGNGGLPALFAACIRCHNCMTVCPICYCKTCLFKTAAFDHPPEYYLNAARRKGAVRMLGDTLLFQMTRLNHMSASCVSCGMCTSACPADIPVGTIFSAVAVQVQAKFDYLPGRDLAEPLPLVTFQANEWTEIGEQK